MNSVNCVDVEPTANGPPAVTGGVLDVVATEDVVTVVAAEVVGRALFEFRVECAIARIVTTARTVTSEPVMVRRSLAERERRRGAP